jgi:hypothetical protein
MQLRQAVLVPIKQFAVGEIRLHLLKRLLQPVQEPYLINGKAVLQAAAARGQILAVQHLLLMMLLLD